MSRAKLYLGLLGAGLLIFFVLLPVIGVVLVLALSILLIAMGALLAAPLLAKIPWFRRWISVEQHGHFRSVRFGRGGFNANWQGPNGPEQSPRGQIGRGEFMDAEGRELPDKEQN